ncbi:MAG: dTMP kinase [Candidatus Peregrinibacteria bacterium]
MTSPLFIVLEGPDGAGTTKHSVILEERLKREGHTVLRTFEPTDGPIGAQIRADLRAGNLSDPEAIQRRFCEDRAWHLEHVIEPAMKNGTIVISDRYAASTITYGLALGIDRAILEEMNAAFRKPDIQLFLLPPFAMLQERLARRESTDAFEKAEFQKKVYAEYRRLAAEDPSIIVIDTSGELEVVADIILKATKKNDE